MAHLSFTALSTIKTCRILLESTTSSFKRTYTRRSTGRRFLPASHGDTSLYSRTMFLQGRMGRSKPFRTTLEAANPETNLDGKQIFTRLVCLVLTRISFRPMIFMRSPKGWTGPRQLKGVPLVNSFRSRQCNHF